MLGPRMGRDVFFYSVTLQPELDTVPILREYAEDVFEAGPGWLFLTGRPQDVDALRRAQGFYDKHPGTAISIEQIISKPPTENSRGLRLGSFVLIRAAIEDELEQAFNGKKPAQEAMDEAVARGNRLLRQFEQTRP